MASRTEQRDPGQAVTSSCTDYEVIAAEKAGDWLRFIVVPKTDLLDMNDKYKGKTRFGNDVRNAIMKIRRVGIETYNHSARTLGILVEKRWAGEAAPGHPYRHRGMPMNICVALQRAISESAHE